MIRTAAVMVSVAISVSAVQAADIPLTLQFSDKALAKLASIDERVTVSAIYTGDPAPGQTVKLNEENQVYLGREEFDLSPRDQTVHIGGSVSGFPSGVVTKPMVNVNIYSSRFADEKNLLDCDILDDAVTVVERKDHILNYKLIGE